MKPITLFYLKNCPFCKKAEAAISELQKQDRYKDIEINRIEESVHPEIAEKLLRPDILHRRKESARRRYFSR